MLVLGVKIDESIMVGNDVEIFVLSNRHGQIRLGIKAPREIAVHRKTIWKRIQAEKAAS
jgi:carbon storage regulator